MAPRSLIFRHKSYHFLSRPNSGFVHRAVNHRQGEFFRTERIFGEDVLVTTNSVACLAGSSNICDNANMARSGSQLTANCWQSSCGAKGVQLSEQSLYGTFSVRSKLGRTSIHDVLRHLGIGLVLHPTDCSAGLLTYCSVGFRISQIRWLAE